MADPEETDGYTTRAGGAAIGARLRRLSERIDRDANRLYAETGVPFEQRWFGVVNLLNLQGAMSVGELAAQLGVSHATVSQVRNALNTAGLVSWEGDKSNPRLRRLRLSPQGQATARRLEPLWNALSETAVELNDEAQNAVGALERLDRAVQRRSLYERVKGKLGEG
ncbi:MarR family transcriptional regulator [Caulobacter sp. 73W]|uniref:MarR family transcriptional regulator n=1 Tax=Caulobacter sp. 73W TaxID=3161137 RepID=A0AB39KVS0_9CAUL